MDWAGLVVAILVGFALATVITSVITLWCVWKYGETRMIDTTDVDLTCLSLIRGPGEWKELPSIGIIIVRDNGEAHVHLLSLNPSIYRHNSLQEAWREHVKGYNKPGVTAAIVTRDRKYEYALDPFHKDAFIGTPAEGKLGTSDERRFVWLEVDWCGNAVGVFSKSS